MFQLRCFKVDNPGDKATYQSILLSLSLQANSQIYTHSHRTALIFLQFTFWLTGVGTSEEENMLNPYNF